MKKRRCTNCKQEEARVCDRVRERYAHRVQALGRFVVDVAAHACDVVLAEVGVPVAVVTHLHWGNGCYKITLGEARGACKDLPAVCGASDASVLPE